MTPKALPAHVQAAISAAAQPRMPAPQPRGVPAHVRAAIAAAAQPRMAAPQPRGMPAHVQASIAAAAQPKLAASSPAPAAHHVHQAIQRAGHPGALPLAPAPLTGPRMQQAQTLPIQPSRKRKRVDDGDEAWVPSGGRRKLYMGSTPSKTSSTGIALLRRWLGRGKARYVGTLTGNARFKDTAKWQVLLRKSFGANRQWVALNATYLSKNGNPKTAIHMGHKLAAAVYYAKGAKGFSKSKLKYRNRYARFMNPGKHEKYPIRRDFMTEPDNYRFEWYSLNSSSGSGGVTYS